MSAAAGTTCRTTGRRSHRFRGLIATLALVLAAALWLPTSVADAGGPPPRPKPTVVLVHGAWADSSSWSEVVRRLQSDGYTVEVPPNPLRGLAGDAAYLTAYLQTIVGPIVLVGHSYGGAVITNAASGNTQRQGARLHQRLHPRSGRDSRPARVRAAGLGPRRRRSDHRVQTGSLPRQHTRRLRRLHRPRRVRGRVRQRPTAAHRRGAGRHAASGHPQRPRHPIRARPPGGRSPPGRWSEPGTGCCRPRSRPRWPNVPARTRSG